jgi:hypothetical protein
LAAPNSIPAAGLRPPLLLDLRTIQYLIHGQWKTDEEAAFLNLKDNHEAKTHYRTVLSRGDSIVALEDVKTGGSIENATVMAEPTCTTT